MTGEDFPDAGSIFIGTEGMMLLPHFSLPALFPKAKFQDFKFPHITGFKHWEQFVEASRGNGKTLADFAYAGPLTEAILLGNIAARFPHTTLEWHAKKMKFKRPRRQISLCAGNTAQAGRSKGFQAERSLTWSGAGEAGAILPGVWLSGIECDS